MQFKKLFAIVLCCVFIFLCIPIQASAENIITVEEVKQNNYFRASYVYIDIQIDDIHNWQSYTGKGTIKKLVDEANTNLAINGVFWNYNKTDKQVIYNGKLLHEIEGYSTRDHFVIYEDGSMECILNEKHQTFSNNIWQCYSFGPALIHNGKILTDFPQIYHPNITDYAHPRTAIGYFEPNHFCLLVVAGRGVEDKGAHLEDMAQFLYDKGCVEAYNLDGGGSSHIWYMNKELGHPCDDRILSDIYYLVK